jgi:AcrR family transcriptional regulator
MVIGVTVNETGQMAQKGRPRTFDREKALKTALRLFWDHGYEGTSIAQLKAAMGINGPSLYAAFGSKEALYREAIDLYERVYGGALLTILTETADSREAVKRLLTAIATLRCEDGPRGCLVSTAETTCGPENSTIARFVASRRTILHDALAARLDRAVAEDDLPADTDTAALAAFYTAMVQGLSVQARDGAEPMVLMAIIDRAMAAWPK